MTRTSKATLKYLALGLGLGIVCWLAGCQQQAKTQATDVPPGKDAPVLTQEGEEEQMQQEKARSTGADMTVPLGKDGEVTGAQNYTELAALDISISNGTLTVKHGDAAPGEVRLEWVIKRDRTGIGQANPRDVVISQSVKDGLLAVADEYKGRAKLSSPQIEMVATVGPDIAAAASLGNGSLVVDCARIKAADCGNGDLTLTGELVDDADVSVGNGKLIAQLMISAGSHDLNVGNGSIRLEAQPGSRFNFNASTGVGSVDVKGAQAKETGRDWGMVGGEVRGTVGAVAANGAAAGGQADLSVGNGSIKIVAE